jgi:hypothetical protein
LNLQTLQVRLVRPDEAERYQALMKAYHYLGSLAKIGETLWYVATYLGEWVALLSFSSAALKCGARDRWIGWNFRHQYSRLNLLTNNSCFLILPAWHYPNLASKTLSLCLKRVPGEWLAHFGHPLLLVETFVDPARFHGTLYKAANWLYLGDTQGFSRTLQGYSATISSVVLAYSGYSSSTLGYLFSWSLARFHLFHNMLLLMLLFLLLLFQFLFGWLYDIV